MFPSHCFVREKCWNRSDSQQQFHLEILMWIQSIFKYLLSVNEYSSALLRSINLLIVAVSKVEKALHHNFHIYVSLWQDAIKVTSFDYLCHLSSFYDVLNAKNVSQWDDNLMHCTLVVYSNLYLILSLKHEQAHTTPQWKENITTIEKRVSSALQDSPTLSQNTTFDKICSDISFCSGVMWLEFCSISFQLK